jgi:ketosteroid isomerase-like protein
MRASTIFIIIFLFCQTFLTADDASIKQSLVATSQRFSATLARGDAAALLSFYSKEAKLMPPKRDVVTGPSAIQSFWKSAFDFGIKARQFQIVDLYSMGNNATTTGTYRLLDAKGKSIETGKYIIVWIKENGEWKVHRDMWSANTAEGCL